MAWIIRPQLHLCQIDKNIVGLDLAQDRYLLFRGETAAQILRFQNERATDADIASLAACGIIEPGDVERDTSASPLLPPRSNLIPDRCGGRLSLLAIKAAIGQTQARLALARNPLVRVFDDLRQKIRQAPTAAPADCQAVVTAFRHARRYVSQTDQCLVCSVAMSTMLARRDVRVQLVIGVALPFAAHSWLQIGETVLSDTLDQVRAYKPIFIL